MSKAIKPTIANIASSFALWGEYVDTDGLDTKAAFAASPFIRRVAAVVGLDSPAHIVDAYSGAFNARLRDRSTIRVGDAVVISADPDARELDEYRQALADYGLTAEWQEEVCFGGAAVDVWIVK